MVAVLLYRIVIILAGVLYPAYSSFKAVRRKSHREYTKWMMYWIVFALFQTTEAFLDTFVSWLPLYYELKIGFVLWLVLPITDGSKQLYRVVVHPFLLKHEGQIDQYMNQIGQSSFKALRRLSQAGFNRAATTVLSSAIKGQAVIAETLLKTQGEMTNQNEAGTNETDGRTDPPSSEREVRMSTSSTDLEPFEVIDDGPEDVYTSVQQPPIAYEGNESRQIRVNSTASSTGSSGQQYQTSNNTDVFSDTDRKPY